MARLGWIVALVVAAALGWCLHERSERDAQLAALETGQQEALARLALLERDLAQARATPTEAPDLRTPAPAATGTMVEGAGPSLAGAPRATPTLEERLARLESRMRAPAAADPASLPPADVEAASAPFVLSSPRFLGSLDQAEKQLKLDATQKAGLERVIEDVERELDALAKRPNESGQTLEELQGALAGDGTPEFGDEAMAKMHERMAALSRFRGTKVPGTNETYAEAERRIRKDGKTRARAFLNADQARTWDRSHTDPLFRGGGGADAAVFVTSFEAAPAIQVTVPDAR